MRKSELKIKLSELAFQVTQNAATEPPFTGEFFDFFEIRKAFNGFCVIPVTLSLYPGFISKIIKKTL